MSPMEGVPEFPKVLALAAPAFFVLVAAEWFAVRKKLLNGRYAAKDAWTSMTMGLGNLVSDLLFGALSLAGLVWLWQFRVHDFGFTLGALLFCLLAQDFFYYWKHRAMHRIRWFWSAHVVHHSSEHYNLSTALRQPWNNHFTGLVLLSAPLVLVGFHPALIGFVASLNLLYQFWIHTEAIHKFPPAIEYVFNTPSHHRVHHSTHPEHLDKNYGGILILWDRVFGTCAVERDGEAMRYGLVRNIKTYNPVKIAFAEMYAVLRDVFAPGLRLRQRLGLAFAPPGYSPDGRHNRSEEILARYRAAASAEPGEERTLSDVEPARTADA